MLFTEYCIFMLVRSFPALIILSFCGSLTFSNHFAQIINKKAGLALFKIN